MEFSVRALIYRGIGFFIGFFLGTLFNGVIGEYTPFEYFFPFIYGFIGYTVGNNLSGNKKIVKADRATQKAAAAMIPSEGKSGIYIIREGFVGSAQGMNITIEGQDNGFSGNTQLKSGLYAYAEVDPGHYNISALPAKNAKETTRIQITTHGNDNAVILAKLSMGALNNSASMKIVQDEAKGKKMVKAAKMVLLEG